MKEQRSFCFLIFSVKHVSLHLPAFVPVGLHHISWFFFRRPAGSETFATILHGCFYISRLKSQPMAGACFFFTSGPAQTERVLQSSRVTPLSASCTFRIKPFCFPFACCLCRHIFFVIPVHKFRSADPIPQMRSNHRFRFCILPAEAGLLGKPDIVSFSFCFPLSSFVYIIAPARGKVYWQSA